MQLRKVIKECLFSFHELKEVMIRGNEEKGDYLKKVASLFSFSPFGVRRIRNTYHLKGGIRNLQRLQKPLDTVTQDSYIL